MGQFVHLPSSGAGLSCGPRNGGFVAEAQLLIQTKIAKQVWDIILSLRTVLYFPVYNILTFNFELRLILF